MDPIKVFADAVKVHLVICRVLVEDRLQKENQVSHGSHVESRVCHAPVPAGTKKLFNLGVQESRGSHDILGEEHAAVEVPKRFFETREGLEYLRVKPVQEDNNLILWERLAVVVDTLDLVHEPLPLGPEPEDVHLDPVLVTYNVLERTFGMGRVRDNFHLLLEAILIYTGTRPRRLCKWCI